MALYETIVIARQDLTVDMVDSLCDKFSKIITDGKGEVVSTEYWGLRSFAYKIKKYSRGHYFLMNINADVPAINELKRIIGFDENVVRSFTFKTHKHDEKTALFSSKKAIEYKASKAREKKEPTPLELKISSVRIEV